MQIASIVRPVKRFLLPTDNLGTAQKLMEDEEFELLPVCAADGALIGAIYRGDTEQALKQEPSSSTAALVESLMSQEPLSCTEADDVMAVAKEAGERDLSQAVVMDEQGGLIGVADLAPYQQSRDPNNGQQNTALDNALEDTFPASDPVPPP